MEIELAAKGLQRVPLRLNLQPKSSSTFAPRAFAMRRTCGRAAAKPEL